MKAVSSLDQSRSAGIQQHAPATSVRGGVTTPVDNTIGVSVIKRGNPLLRFGFVKMGKDGCGY